MNNNSLEKDINTTKTSSGKVVRIFNYFDSCILWIVPVWLINLLYIPAFIEKQPGIAAFPTVINYLLFPLYFMFIMGFVREITDNEKLKHKIDKIENYCLKHDEAILCTFYFAPPFFLMLLVIFMESPYLLFKIFFWGIIIFLPVVVYFVLMLLCENKEKT